MNESKLSVVRAVLASGAIVVGSAAHAQVITEWDFGVLASEAPDNTPSATTGSGTATSLGMTNGYTYTTNGVTTGVGAVTYDDITNDSPSGTKDGSTLGNGNVWRIRGQAGTGTTGTTNNGWNNSAPEYSQGAEFDTSTLGYNLSQLSFNWAATTQGIANLQVQYNLNTSNSSGWTNLGSVLSATIDNNTTGTNGAGFQTDLVSLSGISGLSNDANFGVRLVAAYNPTLGNEYASATSVVSGAPVQYNDNSGNWRIADVQIDGTAIAPVPLPASAWLMLSGLGGLSVLRRRRGVARA